MKRALKKQGMGYESDDEDAQNPYASSVRATAVSALFHYSPFSVIRRKMTMTMMDSCSVLRHHQNHRRLSLLLLLPAQALLALVLLRPSLGRVLKVQLREDRRTKTRFQRISKRKSLGLRLKCRLQSAPGPAVLYRECRVRQSWPSELPAPLLRKVVAHRRLLVVIREAGHPVHLRVEQAVAQVAHYPLHQVHWVLDGLLRPIPLLVEKVVLSHQLQQYQPPAQQWAVH